jgi:hypothetical protein
MLSFTSIHRTRLAVLLAGVLIGAPAQAGQPSDAQHRVLVEAAAQAQSECFKQMYRDSNAYTQCIRNLRNAQPPKSLKRLGVEYFGFVGALSYMRVSHQNATTIAGEFLSDFRRTQASLGVDDAKLCSAVPGNCEVRMAQTREMLAKPPAKPTGMQVRCIGSVCSLVPAP